MQLQYARYCPDFVHPSLRHRHPKLSPWLGWKFTEAHAAEAPRRTPRGSLFRRRTADLADLAIPKQAHRGWHTHIDL